MPTDRRIVVACNDPGGARALLPVAQELAARKGVTVLSVVAGAAERLIDPAQWGCDVESVDDGIDQAEVTSMLESFGADTVVTGAGTYNLVEHTFRLAAAEREIFSVSFVDYWNEWVARFQRSTNGETVVCRPDVVCAIDDTSLRGLVAEAGFREGQVVVTGSPMLEQSMTRLGRIRGGDLQSLRSRYGIEAGERAFVFFSDAFYVGPGGVYETGGGARFDGSGVSRFGYTPDGMLSAVLVELARAAEACGERVRLMVKPHPREHPEKLQGVLQKCTCPYVRAGIVEDAVSLELIAIVDAVLGMGSIVMIEAALAGVLTFSVQIGLRGKDIYDPCPGNAIGLTVPVLDSSKLREVAEGLVAGRTEPAWQPDTSAMSLEGAARRVADACCGGKQGTGAG